MVILKINLACLKYNLDFIKKRINVPMYAVVKADAYGHGAEICKFIEENVCGFAVSCASEAEELRQLKTKKPVLILCPVASPAEKLNRDNIIYTVCKSSDLNAVRGESVAVKINSGMNRLGADEFELEKIKEALKSGGTDLAEVFTHFSSLAAAPVQFKRFDELRRILPAAPWHCCASSALSLPREMHGDAVRCGLALYGYGFEGLLPVLHAYTYIGQINFVKKGEHVGYGEYVAGQDMKIAVLKAGYADGIKRFKGRYVRINGYSCRIVGLVCMDMCMADVTEACAEEGDRAYFLDNILNAEQLAAEQNTIAYEILTLFSAKRIKRIYE